MNTNSNTYTIVYATIVVIIVAVLLALAHLGLKNAQDEKVRLDQQKQMLVALQYDLNTCADPAAEYDKILVDTIQKSEDGQKANILKFQLANGETKYVLRLHGAGLWGGIGGYLALNDDKNTIYGVNFNHESETPGLGALIVEKKFREQFDGKQIRKDGQIVSVAVMKSGKTCDAGADYQVDAVSGATITSTGVSEMLLSNLEEYKDFLNKED
jgi:Na+-transporting NADH:ubiquinone oxidoreductase subunit C